MMEIYENKGHILIEKREHCRGIHKRLPDGKNPWEKTKLIDVMKRLIYILSFYMLTFSLASCDFVAAGSYPYAQGYDFEVSTMELMRRLKEVKKEHPELNVLTTNESGDTVEMDDEGDSFYYVYFKVKTQKNNTLDMICAVYRNLDPAVLVFYSTTSDWINFKDINTDDLTDEENEFMKCCFEEKILNRTKLKWQRR